MTALKACIANTHDDYEIYKETLVELDEKKRLVISLNEYDYSYPRFHRNNDLICSTKAYIEFDDVWKIASKLKIHVVDFPDYFHETFGLNHDGECEDVVSIFRSMLNFVHSIGAHYTLKRKNMTE